MNYLFWFVLMLVVAVPYAAKVYELRQDVDDSSSSTEEVIEDNGGNVEDVNQNVTVNVDQSQSESSNGKDKPKKDESNSEDESSDETTTVPPSSSSEEDNSGSGSCSGKCCSCPPESKDAVSLLFKSYDKAVTPKSTKPLKVGLALIFEYVKWDNNILSVSMYEQESWNDERFVRKDGITRFKADSVIDSMWEPDLFVRNALTPTIVTESGFVNIKTNGDVFYSKQVQTQFFCPAAKKATKVTCTLTFTSYTFDSAIKLGWDANPKFTDDKYNKVLSYYPTKKGNILTLALKIQIP